MKKTIDALLSKKEIRRMTKKDSQHVISADEDEIQYVTSDKVIASSLKIRKRRKSKDEQDDNTPENLETELGINVEGMPTIDYGRLKDDVARLESYEDLSKQYKLTQEQMETASQLYGYIKEAENAAESLGNEYKQMGETVKEIADSTRRVMEEITGSYIKDISEYRHTP